MGSERARNVGKTKVSECQREVGTYLQIEVKESGAGKSGDVNCA